MSYIPDSLRQEVWQRAAGNCEYCRLNERFTLKKHEVDHIRAQKHGGKATSDNLCLSCFECNRHKGSDLSSVDPVTDEVAVLYHPRRDQWAQHFQVADHGQIIGLTTTGRATVMLLSFNDPGRVSLRAALIRLGQFALE